MSGEDAMALVNPSTSAAVSILSQTKIKDLPAGEARFSRFRIPNGDVDRNDADAFWRSPVDLTSTQIAQLADEIVEQVRTRGPFLSMAEFVNRQIGLESDTKAQSGAIQAAIDKVGINSSVATSVGGGVTIASTETGTLMLANPKALEGDSAQGAPGYLMQSDVLAVLGNTATVRSDTFKIRAYGEALDKNSNITARVFCEAIVQRLPDYVDSQNKASAAPAALNATNQVFGRRFKIVSLSWLSPGEI
jgi:hypothetical protein